MNKYNEDTKSTLGVAAVFMLITRLFVNGLGIISSLILVRLLTPEDFGVAAIAMAVFAFIGLFGEFGFNTALIQKSNPIKSDYDTVFTANLIFGVVACVCLFLGATELSVFFENESLINVFRVLSCLFLINGFKNVKAIDFQIKMDFKKEMKLQVVPKLLSFFTTLLLAIVLESYWALILGSVLFSGFTVLFSYLMIPYRPSFSLVGVSVLFNYSKWLMLNNLFYYLNNKSIDLIVGKFISTNAAGIYSISKEMATLPATEIAAPINKASFPAYSRAKNNLSELKQIFYHSTSMIAILALPASLGLLATADFFVPTILGEKWLSAIPIIELLAVFALLSSISSNNSYVFLALGKSKLVAIISLFRILVFFVTLFVFDLVELVEGPAIALIVASFVNLAVFYILLKKEISISFIKAIVHNIRILTSAVFMFLLIINMKSYFQVSLICFFLLVFLGAVSYSMLIYFFWMLSGKPESIEKRIMDNLFTKLRGFV